MSTLNNNDHQLCQLKQDLAEIQHQLASAQSTIQNLEAQLITEAAKTPAGPNKAQFKHERRKKSRDLRKSYNRRKHEESQAKIKAAYARLLVQFNRKPFVAELARAAHTTWPNAKFFMDRLEQTGH